MYKIEDSGSGIRVSDLAISKWTKLQMLYQTQNPHITMDPQVIYEHKPDGGLRAKLKGTDLVMDIEPEDWSWTE